MTRRRIAWAVATVLLGVAGLAWLSGSTIEEAPGTEPVQRAEGREARTTTETESTATTRGAAPERHSAARPEPAARSDKPTGTRSFAPPVVDALDVENRRPSVIASPSSSKERMRQTRRIRNTRLNDRLARRIAELERARAAASGPERERIDAALEKMRRLHRYRAPAPGTNLALAPPRR